MFTNDNLHNNDLALQYVETVYAASQQLPRVEHLREKSYAMDQADQRYKGSNTGKLDTRTYKIAQANIPNILLELESIEKGVKSTKTLNQHEVTIVTDLVSKLRTKIDNESKLVFSKENDLPEKEDIEWALGFLVQARHGITTNLEQYISKTLKESTDAIAKKKEEKEEDEEKRVGNIQVASAKVEILSTLVGRITLLTPKQVKEYKEKLEEVKFPEGTKANYKHVQNALQSVEMATKAFDIATEELAKIFADLKTTYAKRDTEEMDALAIDFEGDAKKVEVKKTFIEVPELINRNSRAYATFSVVTNSISSWIAKKVAPVPAAAAPAAPQVEKKS